jgi:hypothetical protein
MAENYPALLQDVWDTRRQRPPTIWSVIQARPGVERYCLPRVNRILTVVEESAIASDSEGFPGRGVNTPSLSSRPGQSQATRGPSGSLYWATKSRAE